MMRLRNPAVGNAKMVTGHYENGGFNGKTIGKPENHRKMEVYPLVNKHNITMDNHHFQWVNPL